MPWDIGSWELLVLAMIAVTIVGPKELPGMLRTFGQWMSKARAMARQFQRSFDELAKETELDELRKGINELKSGGPIGGLKKDLEKTIDPIKREFGDYDPTATKASSVNGSSDSLSSDRRASTKSADATKSAEAQSSPKLEASDTNADTTKIETPA